MAGSETCIPGQHHVFALDALPATALPVALRGSRNGLGHRQACGSFKAGARDRVGNADSAALRSIAKSGFVLSASLYTMPKAGGELP